MEEVIWRSSCVAKREQMKGLDYAILLCAVCFKSSVFSALVDESVLLVLFL